MACTFFICVAITLRQMDSYHKTHQETMQHFVFQLVHQNKFCKRHRIWFQTQCYVSLVQFRCKVHKHSKRFCWQFTISGYCHISLKRQQSIVVITTELQLNSQAIGIYFVQNIDIQSSLIICDLTLRIFVTMRLNKLKI